MVAEPCSPRRLDHRRPARSNVQHGKQLGPGGDRRHDEFAVPTQLDRSAAGGDSPSRGDGRSLVTAGGQPGSFAGSVDAADLHRDRGKAGKAEHQDRDEGRDAQCRLDCGRAGIVG
jgi:hypothetical protein